MLFGWGVIEQKGIVYRLVMWIFGVERRPVGAKTVGAKTRPFVGINGDWIWFCFCSVNMTRFGFDFCGVVVVVVAFVVLWCR